MSTINQNENVLSWKSAWPRSAFSAWLTLSHEVKRLNFVWCMISLKGQRVKLGEHWVSTKIQSIKFIQFLSMRYICWHPIEGICRVTFGRRRYRAYHDTEYSRKSAQWSAANSNFSLCQSWCSEWRVNEASRIFPRQRSHRSTNPPEQYWKRDRSNKKVKRTECESPYCHNLNSQAW